MYEIIDNAEIPQNRFALGNSQYPFAHMKVGQGFDAPRDSSKTKSGHDRCQNRVSVAARTYARKYDPTAKFTTRILDENTVRCVRIA